ncbi:DMT family transporter [Blastochloris viridis]|uniref:Guanidinium exporter n=1 Tax=Blastochloris viridis TaxID=1079 RepID=A0A0H5BDB5_BLAVI|nr:multidrug efflux SMR transporter [Blastochloris viridis]ALK10924.1 Quaternary ammonium compound-resistance protein SugE [Blastochloris viridis]BAR99094.1 quaternary ammonium compound-resistance protein SugE [Blastochloris viridis]CUU43586.1 Quaternary ammonium compound-resistance protein sugE [Blastochloris viridis]
MAWLALFLAGLLEIVFAFSMKLSEGFTRPGPTAITVVSLIGSLMLLSVAMKALPLGTAYAVWTGIGAAGAFAVGIVFLGEPMTALRMLAAALIVSGIVLMKLAAE